MAQLDVRPPALDLKFLPGTTVTIVANWSPTGSLSGRTFTATLAGTELTTPISIVGDVMTIVATDTETRIYAAAFKKGVQFALLEDIDGTPEPVIVGLWRPSSTGTAGPQHAVAVTQGAATVTVTPAGVAGSTTGDMVVGGDLAVAGDVALAVDPPAGGVAAGGVLRPVQSVQIPWDYTQTVDPTDPAVGTAYSVAAQVTLAAGQGIDGPNFSTGLFGPRGIYNLEGLVRYATDQGLLSLAPIGWADVLATANDDGADRVITPAWTFMSARQWIAQDGTVTLHENDTNSGGAAFVSTPVYMTTDGGEIDGLTNDTEATGVLIGGLHGGNSNLRRRIGLDVAPAQRVADVPFEGVIEVGQPYPDWTGAGEGALGIVDADAATIVEEIGVRIRKFSIGTTKIGLRSSHPIELLAEDITHDGQHTLISTKDSATRVLTLTGTNTAGVSAFTFSPTVLFEDNSNPFAAMTGFSIQPRLKNVQGEARTLGLATSYHCAPTVRGDGAALTVTSHTGYIDLSVVDVANSGTVAISAMSSFVSAPSINSGVTLTSRRGLQIQNPGGSGGTLTTNIGIDIDAQTRGTTNIGLRNAATEVLTPTAANIGAAGDTIPATARVIRLNNTTGAGITLTSTPTIADGQDGQILELICSSAQSVTLTRGATNNLRLGAATRALTTGDSIRLMFSTTLGDWVELSYSGDITT